MSAESVPTRLCTLIAGGLYPDHAAGSRDCQEYAGVVNFVSAASFSRPVSAASLVYPAGWTRERFFADVFCVSAAEPIKYTVGRGRGYL